MTANKQPQNKTGPNKNQSHSPRETDRQADRQTETERHKETGRDRGRQTDRDTEKQRQRETHTQRVSFWRSSPLTDDRPIWSVMLTSTKTSYGLLKAVRGREAGGGGGGYLCRVTRSST